MNINKSFYQSLFGEHAEKLPAILKKRYANHPYSGDTMTMRGKMNVDYSSTIRFVSPVLKILGVLAPYKGQDIPVTVTCKSEPHSPSIQFERVFYFPGKKPYHFYSSIQCRKENDLMETMRFGLTWRARCSYDGNKVLLQHNGYFVKIFGLMLPLPISFLIGKTYCEEQAISDDSFRMLMNITHPLLGKLFEYTGSFRIVDPTP